MILEWKLDTNERKKEQGLVQFSVSALYCMRTKEKFQNNLTFNDLLQATMAGSKSKNRVYTQSGVSGGESIEIDPSPSVGAGTHCWTSNKWRERQNGFSTLLRPITLKYNHFALNMFRVNISHYMWLEFLNFVQLDTFISISSC